MSENGDTKPWNVFSQVAAMKPLMRAGDWDGLDRRAQMLCLEHAGERGTRRISRISFSRYRAALTSILALAGGKASSNGAKAIYFEFDMDNGWQSWFFICSVFPARWNRILGIDYLEEISGPPMPKLAKIYDKLQFIGLAGDACMIGCLIARTFASFGRASKQFAHSEISLGIAFHDQDEIIKINGRSLAA